MTEVVACASTPRIDQKKMTVLEIFFRIGTYKIKRQINSSASYDLLAFITGDFFFTL